MKVFVQVVGADTGDSTPTLLVFFDAKRYLFNCGEGTQRLCTEYKVRLSRVDNIFLTRLSWENVGGLPGMRYFWTQFQFHRCPPILNLLHMLITYWQR